MPGAMGTQPSADVIDRGLLSLDLAEQLFKAYNEWFVPHYPCVVFPPDCSIHQVRQDRPIIFLACLSVAAGMMAPDLHSTLSAEIIQVFANRVMLSNEKSLDLVQAFLVTSVWYFPPDSWGMLKFYEYVHMAASMGLDLGLNTRSQISDFKDRARTLLSCYITCAG